MSDFTLLNYAGARGEPRSGILAGESVVDLQEALPGKAWTGSTLAVLGAWDEALPALHALAGAKPAAARRLSDVELLAPLLYPPAIYCAGANYSATRTSTLPRRSVHGSCRRTRSAIPINAVFSCG